MNTQKHGNKEKLSIKALLVQLLLGLKKLGKFQFKNWKFQKK